MAKKNKSETLASEIIADQAESNKKLKIAVTALSVTLAATLIRDCTKGSEQK